MFNQQFLRKVLATRHVQTVTVKLQWSDQPGRHRTRRCDNYVHLLVSQTPKRRRTSLLDIGVGGIMTDRPSVLKQVMEERGQWVS